MTFGIPKARSGRAVMGNSPDAVLAQIGPNLLPKAGKLQNFFSSLMRHSQEMRRDEFQLMLRFLFLSAFRRLVLKTPVGNPDLWAVNDPKHAAGIKVSAPPGYVGGRARGNWQYSKGSIPITQLEEAVDEAGDATLTKALADFTEDMSRFRLGDTIFISNTVPYIERLEDGHSRQAPHGMLALTVEELRGMFT